MIVPCAIEWGYGLCLMYEHKSYTYFKSKPGFIYVPGEVPSELPRLQLSVTYYTLYKKIYLSEYSRYEQEQVVNAYAQTRID